MTTVRAVVAHGAGDLRVERRPAPEPGPGEVAVAVRYGGICGSDLHYWRHGAVGDFRLREPLVLGHEVVGAIRSAGPGVGGVEPGTPVAVLPATDHLAMTGRAPDVAPMLDEFLLRGVDASRDSPR